MNISDVGMLLVRMIDQSQKIKRGHWVMLGEPNVGNMQEMSKPLEPLYVLNSVRPGHFSREKI
eukprot:1194289-Prorocentrum_minimum.AAC.1